MPTLETDQHYWDCECEEEYIHPKTEKECPICGAEKDEQPDSRVEELKKYGWIPSK